VCDSLVVNVFTVLYRNVSKKFSPPLIMYSQHAIHSFRILVFFGLCLFGDEYQDPGHIGISFNFTPHFICEIDRVSTRHSWCSEQTVVKRVYA
jgi:hypothetical protein